MSQYLSEELEWLNNEARAMVETLAGLSIARLGAPKIGIETFDVFDAYLYARTTLAKSLAQHRGLFSNDKSMDSWTAELYSRELAKREMHSARTRRVVSGKLTRIIKKYRAEHEEQRTENGIGPFQDKE